MYHGLAIGLDLTGALKYTRHIQSQRNTLLIELSNYHTFGFRNHAARVIQLQQLEQLPVVSEGPLYILGEGSNSIFVEDFAGTVLKVSLKGIEISETDDLFRIRVAAGENWHDLVTMLMTKGIYGAENLALIPGTLGAAPIQNIGAYGRELAEFCTLVETVNLTTGVVSCFTATECQFGYRDSLFKRAEMASELITYVHMDFPKHWIPQCSYGELQALGSTPTAQQIFDKVVEVRRAKLPDPGKIGNAGSFFKNPVIQRRHFLSLQHEWKDIPCYPVDEEHVKVPAAWLIDRLGFKGKTIGGVACHLSQPLVLVNQAEGTGDELLQLARNIKQSVKKEFSIDLENEVRLIGKQGQICL
ncbi:UDP-N-acetylmuramate dehydrogenase [Bowmanella dokdonensis]